MLHIHFSILKLARLEDCLYLRVDAAVRLALLRVGLHLRLSAAFLRWILAYLESFLPSFCRRCLMGLGRLLLTRAACQAVIDAG